MNAALHERLRVALRWVAASCLILFTLSACATSSNLCDGFTDWVEPARAAYFPRHRIYPLQEEHKRLAKRYQPRLVMHPNGVPPIDFDDYLRGAELVEHRTNARKKLDMKYFQLMSYSDQCKTYIEAESETITSQTPYPWYVQIFEDEGPGGESGWVYLKYNVIFDWSGLAQHISPSASAGVRLLGARPDKWHRLDVHTSAIIGLDARRRQRLLTITQHNYARTYLAGPEFDASQPVTLAIAARSNELYLDKGYAEKQFERVVRFYDDLPYLVSGENRPRYSGLDEVVGLNAGGTLLPTRLVFVAPDYPLASFAGLLAPPKRILGNIYIGRDGPMGYDYYAPPASFRMPRGAALGYWQPGNGLVLERLSPVMEKMSSFRDENVWNFLLNVLEDSLAEDLRGYVDLVVEQTQASLESVKSRLTP